MKIKKRIFIAIVILLCIMIGGYYYILKKKAVYNGEKLFLNNIKAGTKNQALGFNDGMVKFEGYNFESFNDKRVINITNNKTNSLREVLNRPNVFINFWYKGCGGCELEMPEIQKFYEKYNNKIQFVIISNDEPENVQKYIKKNEFTMPFYVFKNDTFPVGIKIFPTSHLIINNKTQFIYAGVGYFDNDGFNQYIDSVLVK